MDLIDEIKIVFDNMKETLPKTEEIVELLDESYEKIVSIICKKNKHMYTNLIQQLTPMPFSG